MSVSRNGMLFIDANQYLDLYRMPSGKALLPGLEEQRDYIFVTEQVVTEMRRVKVSATATFLKEQLKNKKIDLKSAYALLGQVSQSEDEVSKGLADLFSRAVSANSEELDRARARKELGNPPGKKGSPLGDQLSWEQILTRYRDELMLWIVSRDSDYATQFEGKLFLNAALYFELSGRSKSAPEVFCFDNIPEALTHFTSTIRVKAAKLPTPAETEEIKKEQESLVPLVWFEGYDDANMIAIQRLYQERDDGFLRAALQQLRTEEEAILPPEI